MGIDAVTDVLRIACLCAFLPFLPAFFSLRRIRSAAHISCLGSPNKVIKLTHGSEAQPENIHSIFMIASFACSPTFSPNK